MPKERERRAAIELLEGHPGWSERRVARAVGVSNSTVGRWRRAAGLAPALTRVGERTERRRTR